MEAPSFVTSTPLSFKATHPACHTHATGHKCPVRAITQPPRPSSSNDENTKPPNEQLRARQAKLDSLFNAEIKPAEGKSGNCECIWCSGKKKRRCSWCEGKGFRHEIVSKSWDQLAEDIEKMQAEGSPRFMKEPEKVPVTCSACQGTKLLRCAYCRGSGVGSYGHAY